MNSIRNRARVARDYMARKTLCDGRPVEFSIELTSRCNLKCVMCPRRDDSARGLGNMSMETFRRIIDAASEYLEFVYLNLAGEPLMHPDFGAFIAYASEKGIKCGISTNGTILDEKKAKMLLASPLDHLIISIDGTTPETYERIRGGNAFANVVRNTERFLRMKREAGGGGPYTIVQMICMDDNASETKEFADRWRREGANAVRLKRFFNFGGHIEDKSYQQPSLVKLRPRAEAPATRKAAAPQRPPCFLLWRQMAFYYNGTAISCCHDFLHETEIGNIHHQTLEEIWNSSAMVELRRLHIEGRQQEIALCAGCNQPNASPSLVAGTTVLNTMQTKKAMIAVERVARIAGVTAPY